MLLVIIIDWSNSAVTTCQHTEGDSTQVKSNVKSVNISILSENTSSDNHSCLQKMVYLEIPQDPDMHKAKCNS